MTKRALSVTLTPDNIAFLRARAAARGSRSLSEALDGLITEARAVVATDPPRSIVGLAMIAEDDPDLSGADAAVRDVFARSVSPRAARASVRRAARG